VVHVTPGSIPLDHYSFHITQVAASGLSGKTVSLSNLARLLMISEAAKFDREAVVPDKPEAATCVVCRE
jgi:hypothetical protein